MSRILALDQSSKITGYAVFNGDKLETWGKFTFEHPNLDVRLVQIRQQVLELITKYNIDEVIYEDIQQQSNVVNNVQTFKILAEVYGVIGELLQELKIPHTTVLAVQWKSTLGIKGRTRVEQKRNAQQYVLDKYGIKATQDECDSICIGLHKIRESVHDWSS